MPVQFFPLSSWMVAVFMVCALGSVLILIDLYRMYRKRQRGETFSWYGSPLLWFAACAFPIGLMIVVIATSSFLYSFFGYWLTASFLLFLFFLAGGLIAVVRWDTQQIALQQETRLRQQAEANPGAVAASSPVTNPLIVGAGLGLAIVSLIPIGIFSFYTHHIPPGLWILPLATYLILMTAVISISSAAKRFYKRLNIRKNLLAFENRHLTPVEFTVQEPLQSLMPPLGLRVKWITIACNASLIAVYISLLLSTTNAQNVLNTILQTLIWPPLLLFNLLRGWRMQVEATTQTLTVTHGIWFARRKQYIPWQEARLFICYQPFSLFKRKTTMIYELAGPVRSVQWARIIDTRSLFMPWKPTLPGEEYARQTQELCAFITRQTGLPLLNLSEEEPNTRKEEILVQSRLQ